MNLKVKFGLLILLLISAVSAFAQTEPCDGTDPDANCPLDNWIVVLVVAAVIFASVYLSRKQKDKTVAD